MESIEIRQNESAPFPVVLHDMLCKESGLGQNSPVQWVENGEAFVLNLNAPPPNTLGDVLQKYFQHNRYASVQRQLNLYGWKKHQVGRYRGAFHHPLFHRDNKEDIHKIKRKTPRRRSTHAKLGTRKRKAKRRSSEDSENSSLLREAALVKTKNTEETYYYASDLSSTNDDNVSLSDDPDERTHNMMMDYSDSEMILENMREPLHDSSGDQDQLQKQGENQFEAGGKQRRNVTVISFRIVLPLSLKKEMLKTWECISQRNLVPSVPAKISVRRVLDMYVEAKIKQTSAGNASGPRAFQEDGQLRKRMIGWKDLAEGIALFFEKALESRLLYPQEQPQLKEMNSNPKYGKKSVAELYGCEHLLRLLLRLPDILSECVSEEKRQLILEDIKDFVRFLHQNQDILFTSSYHSFGEAEAAAHKKMMQSIA